MSILDIFDNDAFGLVEMSEGITRRPYVPQGLADMGIFTPKYIRTEDVAIEMGSSKLNLIATTSRGEPLEQLGKRSRNIRKYSTTRIGLGTRIYASELDFLRGINQEQQMTSLAQEVADRLGHGTNVGILDNIDLTLEHMMLGAVQGKVLDKDGTIIQDWAQEFDNALAQGGTGQIKTVEWQLKPEEEGDFRIQCNQVMREIIKSSGGAFNKNSKVMNLCHADFFDQLTKIPELRESYRNQEQAYYVKGGDVFGEFEYPAGMVWKEYRGDDDDSKVKIEAGECVTFPAKTNGGFLEVFAHGETFEDLHTKGKRYYAKTLRTREDTYVDLKAMSYPLLVCTIPKSLRKGTIRAVIETPPSGG